MPETILRCIGGEVALPEANLVLVDRADGGNLIVNPPRDVWDRSELTPVELTKWQFLVAATAKAMLLELPQLDGGCINYWDAGNWSLNEAADPRGPKNGRAHRHVHLHLLGRSRHAKSASHAWGEAVLWPAYAERFEWTKDFKRLNDDECKRIVDRTIALLRDVYGMAGERPGRPLPADTSS